MILQFQNPIRELNSINNKPKKIFLSHVNKELVPNCIRVPDAQTFYDPDKWEKIVSPTLSMEWGMGVVVDGGRPRVKSSLPGRY